MFVYSQEYKTYYKCTLVIVYNEQICIHHNVMRVRVCGYFMTRKRRAYDREAQFLLYVCYYYCRLCIVMCFFSFFFLYSHTPFNIIFIYLLCYKCVYTEYYICIDFSQTFGRQWARTAQFMLPENWLFFIFILIKCVLIKKKKINKYFSYFV